jgi:hypothetical protein
MILCESSLHGPVLVFGQVISEKISTTVMTTAHLTRRVRKAKKVQMAVTYHILVSQGMSNICISVLFIPVVYIAMCKK